MQERKPIDPAAVEQCRRTVDKVMAMLVLGRAGKKVSPGAIEFYSAIMCHLEMRFITTLPAKIPTAGTDGKSILWNPIFINEQTDKKVLGTAVHEVMHVAGMHDIRRMGRLFEPWNWACDLEINGPIRESGLELPDGCLYPGEGAFDGFPPNESAEHYYMLIEQKLAELIKKLKSKMKADGGSGKGNGESEDGEIEDIGGCGVIMDGENGPPSGSEETARRNQVESAAQQAAMRCKDKGGMPAGLERFIQRVTRPQIPWSRELRFFVTEKVKRDACWWKPHKRYHPQGIWLPTKAGRSLGHLVIIADTSGSMGDRELEVAGNEIFGAAETFPSKVTVIWSDADVQNVQTWERGDPRPSLKPKGGGGSDLRPSFEWIARHAADAAVIICITDLCITFPERKPKWPIIWVATTNYPGPGYGRIVRVKT